MSTVEESSMTGVTMKWTRSELWRQQCTSNGRTFMGWYITGNPQKDPSHQNGHFGQDIKAVIYLLTTNLDCQLSHAFHVCWLSSMTILEQILLFYFLESNWLKYHCFFIKYAPKKGQIVPRLDGRRYALPITRNHTMITDISVSVLYRTIGWFVFVTIVLLSVSYAHSMIVVDREWYVWFNCFVYIPNTTKEATNGMAK